VSLQPGLDASDTQAGVPDLSADSIRARSRHENFPVALRVLTRDQRRHLLAIYDFARATDELGDTAPGSRTAHLDAWEAGLDSALARGLAHPILCNLAASIRERSLPLEPFRALIEANRQDQRVRCYATFEDLVGYCRLSANPIGELVLHVFDCVTPRRLQLSNQVCTALQLVEHWQDVREDCAAGRIYLPADNRERFGVREADLTRSHPTPRLVALLRFETQRAAAWLAAGTPLVRSLTGRARFAVAGFVAGGRAAIDSLERSGFDVSRGAPPVRKRRFARHLVGLCVQGVVGSGARE
jgi:squalene synthase HpnC